MNKLIPHQESLGQELKNKTADIKESYGVAFGIQCTVLVISQYCRAGGGPEKSNQNDQGWSSSLMRESRSVWRGKK